MRYSWVLLVIGCGSVDSGRHITDAQSTVAKDASPDATGSGSGSGSGCSTYIASTTTSNATLTYTLVGGAFQSYGCAPIDPNYWMSGSGMSVMVTFAEPQDHPSLRVWGMNDDDTASLMVNGAAYPLTTTSASLDAKVVCGQSPGPDGMTFSSGILTGVNSNATGNYSYQDLTIDEAAVTSFQLASLTGAGWGFAGTSVAGCAN